MRVHASWFIGWWCLGFLGGAGLCAAVTSTSIYCLLISGLLCIVACTKPYRAALVLVITAGCLAGMWRGSILKADLQAYQPYYAKTVTVSGMVAQDASIGAQGDQRLNLKKVTINGASLAGEMWVSIVKKDIKRGDTITVRGKLGEGFGNLSATMYRAEVVAIIRPSPGDVARRVRDWFAAGVRHGIPDPQASLGLGYLVGQKSALPEDLEADIKTVGLTHVVVASGYNLTILVVFSRRLFLRVSKYFATLASGIMIMSFMLITGLSPSMTRAGLVAGLGLLVWYYGRKMHPFVLLSFAAAVTVMVQPSYIWGDLGWYLSFLSFIGVIVLAPLVHHYFWGLNNDPGTIRGLIVETLSAQIITTPIILMSFGLFSVYALVANILVLPLVPLAMLCTFIAGIAGLVAPAVSPLIAMPATIILKYSTEVIEWTAALPNSQIEIIFNPPVMLISYIGLSILVTFLIRRTHHDFRNPKDTHEVF